MITPELLFDSTGRKWALVPSLGGERPSLYHTEDPLCLFRGCYLTMDAIEEAFGDILAMIPVGGYLNAAGCDHRALYLEIKAPLTPLEVAEIVLPSTDSPF